jgi:acyl-CoA hydrolase
VSRDRTSRALSNSCLFTFVNVDAALAPEDVPEVHPTMYAEDARALAARRNLRSLLEHTRKGWIATALAATAGR